MEIILFRVDNLKSEFSVLTESSRLKIGLEITKIKKFEQNKIFDKLIIIFDEIAYK